MFESLRQSLAQRSVAPTAVALPGYQGPLVEGALTLRKDESLGRWVLETLDYGRAYPLATAEDEAGAEALLLAYLDRPLPPATTVSAAYIESVNEKNAGHVQDLIARTQENSLLIELPAGVAVDRVGALDGTILAPYGTTLGARSLPPYGALPAGTEYHAFITRKDILVRAETAKPWFGQPGGGLRFTIAEDYVGVRDLVISGRLERVDIER
ncbi:TNT domain-containing protein [Microbacterium stercoris]|uniref:TNT domain-containing protein n=1 Tax=Microbacterium stercoris TaxID=2820289 RepID=A0A939TWK4_9MICO|nr:TNT domain-containing protein [Microbacterium stercoris]MBO3662747.1 TNT domain-containing protein [Microbacterium stercoris]